MMMVVVAGLDEVGQVCSEWATTHTGMLCDPLVVGWMD